MRFTLEILDKTLLSCRWATDPEGHRENCSAEDMVCLACPLHWECQMLNKVAERVVPGASIGQILDVANTMYEEGRLR